MLLMTRSSDPQGVIFAIAAVVVVLAAVYYFQRKRTKEMIAAAGNIGFMPAEDVPINCEMPVFASNRISTSNIFQGTYQGLDATFFDLRIARGKSSINETLAGYRKPGLNIPPFQIHGTNFTDKLAGIFSTQIVAINADANFAQRFTVRSPSKEECERFFTPQVIEYFSQMPHDKWTVEGSVDSVIVYRRGKTVPPSNLEGFMSETAAIAAGLFGLLQPTSVL